MKYFLCVVFGFLLAFLIFKDCSKEADLQESLANIKEKLRIEQGQRDSLERRGLELSALVDSLLTQPDKIKIQIVYREREIDENIAKDSANAIVEFRRSLAENQELPDKTDYPTYRELGLSSKLMSRVPQLALTIEIQDSTISTLKKIKEGDEFIKKSYKETLKIKDLEVEKWKLAFDKERVWYHEDLLWFGAGVLSTVAIIFLTK